MAAQDRARWDRVYRQQRGIPFPTPDPLLFDYTPPVPDPENKPWRALDLAAGMGQNGLWLASQGYITDIMDISRVALSRARDEMNARQLSNVNLLQIDLDDVDIEDEHYHLVAVFRYLKRDLFKQIQACIAPGGRIIYETYNVLYLDIVPGFNPEFLLSVGELKTFFADWTIIHYNEDDHITQLVAQKPG